MVRRATVRDFLVVAKLANELWSNHSLEELLKEFKEFLSSNKNCIFIYYVDNKPIAFVHCSLRYEYVEGTETSPVAYLEGIYVKENFRLKGVAQELIIECEKWARTNNCREIASDCELENEISYKFHLKNGFKEANKIICFTKKL